ncbi:GNAT family N-acetyltransferase [Virgibacillus halophilus]|uniref:GNAT family N-acetyltransferase n=1 Tax=Tigheibacillus halophilus TaxID=361280 RepID=A0ABU5C3K6_9BACI|nr:GNAT family N-acetyltransferase [Virgibacillus halophilus]
MNFRLIFQKRSIIFITTTDRKTIGTATAWFGTWETKEIGRLHWVEIIPAYQGKKLGRSLIAKAMSWLADYHESAFLKTQTSSQAAIHIYQKLGWKPAITSQKIDTPGIS